MKSHNAASPSGTKKPLYIVTCTTPPLAAIARIWSSVRLRGWSHSARHDEWEHTPVKTKELQYRPNAIISVVLLSMISVATLIFIIFWLLEKMLWQIFVYALPAVLLAALILTSVWKKSKATFYILSALMVSIVGVIYTAICQAGGNPWQLFLLCIPLELIIIFSYLVKKRNKEK